MDLVEAVAYGFGYKKRAPIDMQVQDFRPPRPYDAGIEKTTFLPKPAANQLGTVSEIVRNAGPALPFSPGRDPGLPKTPVVLDFDQMKQASARRMLVRQGVIKESA